MANGPRRSRRKPPAGTRCQATVGIDHDFGGHSPRLRLCPNDATVEILDLNPVGETWVCESCAETLMRRYGGEG